MSHQVRIAIEQTPSSVRAVQVEGWGRRLRIKRWCVEPLQPDEPIEGCLGRLARWLDARRALVISAIPREQVLTRSVSLPAIRLDELERIVQLSGKAQFPYPPHKVIVAFQVMDQDDTASAVQMVACRRELIEQHLALLRQAVGEPAVITASAWGVFAWYERFACSSEIREPVLVINVDADRTDLVMVHASCLRFSRTLDVGVDQWQVSGQGLERCLEELRRSLSSVRQEWPDGQVQTVILTGIGALTHRKSLLEEHLGSSVVVSDPFGSLCAPTTDSTLNASPVVALGLAMAAPEWLVNLLPPDARKAQQHRRWMHEAVQIGTLGLLVCGLGVGLLGTQVTRKARMIAQTEALLKRLEPEAALIQSQERDIHTVQQVLASRRATAQMLAELFRITPESLAYDDLSVERSRGETVLHGSAPTTRHVLEYLGQLQQSAAWDRAELRSSSRRGTSAKPQTGFELVLRQGAF